MMTMMLMMIMMIIDVGDNDYKDNYIETVKLWGLF